MSIDFTNTEFSLAVRKWSRVVSYVLLAVGSYLGMFLPSPVISEASGEFIAKTWALIFALSATACVIGVITEYWIIEYAGIPMLSAVFLVYSISMFTVSFDEGLARMPVAFFLLGISVYLFSRFREISLLFKKPTTPPQL